MNKPKIALLTGVLLSFIIAGSWVGYTKYLGSSRQPITRTAHFKPIPPLYTIQSEIKGDEVEVRNVEEGVSLLVPKKWAKEFATELAQGKDPLILGFSKYEYEQEGGYDDNQGIQGLIDVSLFKFDNEKNLSFDEFVNQPGEDERLSRLGIKDNFQKTIWKSRPAYYSTRKDIEPNVIEQGPPGYGVGDQEPYFIVNNSLVTSYFIPANNSKNIFLFICTARGRNFQTHIKECQTLLKEKLILP